MRERESREMSSEVAAPSETRLRSTTLVPTDWLVLDHGNPRLVSVSAQATDAGVVAALYQGEDLGELLSSIAANGYLDIEPLIVLEKAGWLVVLEGNRRLAAIRLFREAGLAARVSEEGGVKVSVPAIPEQYRETLNRVTVYRVASREEAWPFIGFKHINGAAKWESYAKAKFAADWYRGHGVTLADIARRTTRGCSHALAGVVPDRAGHHVRADRCSRSARRRSRQSSRSNGRPKQANGGSERGRSERQVPALSEEELRRHCRQDTPPPSQPSPTSGHFPPPCQSVLYRIHEERHHSPAFSGKQHGKAARGTPFLAAQLLQSSSSLANINDASVRPHLVCGSEAIAQRQHTHVMQVDTCAFAGTLLPLK